MAASAPRSATSDVCFSVGGRLLELVTRREFAGLIGIVDDSLQFRALLPSGAKAWTGPAAAVEVFQQWFGHRDQFEVVDAAVGAVGSRLQLRWRLRVRSAELGPDWFDVEQCVYADTTPAGRIGRIDLLCSGFCPEPSDG